MGPGKSIQVRQDNLVGTFERDFVPQVLLSRFRISVSSREGGLCLQVYDGRRELVHESWCDVLLHLSDESLNHDRELYEKFRLILRQYALPSPLSRGRGQVFTVPLGFGSGTGAQLKQRSKQVRKYMVAFIGENKGRRRNDFDQLAGVNPSFVHWTHKWADPLALPPEEVHETYQQSAFVFCPPGNVHPDTFRVMEALEAGAIPVVRRFYGFDWARWTFGQHPFVVGWTWKSLGARIQALWASPERLRRYRGSVETWYVEFKELLSQDVETLVLMSSGDDSFGYGLKGSQWSQQIRLNRSPIARLIFRYHFHWRSKGLIAFLRRVWWKVVGGRRGLSRGSRFERGR